MGVAWGWLNLAWRKVSEGTLVVPVPPLPLLLQLLAKMAVSSCIVSLTPLLGLLLLPAPSWEVMAAAFPLFGFKHSAAAISHVRM